MDASSFIGQHPRGRRDLRIVPLVAAFLALSAVSLTASVDALARVMEPIQRASSDTPAEPSSAFSLGGDLLP